MKSKKTKKIEKDRVKIVKAGKKKISRGKAEVKKAGVKKIENHGILPVKPLAKIAEKIRAKVLNAKAVEAAMVSVPPKVQMGQVGKKRKIAVGEMSGQVVNGMGGMLPKAGNIGSGTFEIKKTKIRIIGIGGGGSNIVSEIAGKVRKSSFFIANTDFAALRAAPKSVTTFQFGENLTHGLGTGMDPRIAEDAANESREDLKKMMEGQDLVILVSSLGGGTGSGAAPVFAQISKNLGNLTYGIFTLPFEFEGVKKNEIARNALEKLKPHLNALTILPNERVFEVVPKATAFSKTLSYVNTMLSDSLEGLVETIYDTGVINIDFADLRAILSGNGKMAFLNTVIFKKGEEANQDSFEKVFGSPLYPYTIDKARGLLLNIVAQKDLKLLEVNKILTSVSGRIHKDARIIFGVAHEGAGINTVKVTVLATGCVYDGFGGGHDSEKEILPPVPLRSEAPAKNAGVAKKSKSAKKTNKPAAHLILPKPPRKINSAKNKKNNSKSSDGKSSAVKKEIVVKVKNSPIEIEAEKRPRTVPGADINDALTNELNAIETRRNIAAQFEMPVRKNALQVKKEIEMEEKEMLEKEKAWEVPAFLRKQKK